MSKVLHRSAIDAQADKIFSDRIRELEFEVARLKAAVDYLKGFHEKNVIVTTLPAFDITTPEESVTSITTINLPTTTGD